MIFNVSLGRTMKKPIQSFNKQALALVEHTAFLVIAIATVIAMSSEVLGDDTSRARDTC